MLKKISIALVLLIPTIYLILPINEQKTEIKSSLLDEKLHKDCLYPTVMLNNKDAYSYGTGFIIQSNKISENEYENVFLTCAHVCATEAEYEIIFYNYKNWSVVDKMETFPCWIYAKNQELDLAIGIFTTTRPMPIVDLDFNSQLFMGDKIFRIGCGLDDDPRLDYGNITSLQTSVSNISKNVMKSNVFTVSGDSGSPVFKDYKVIGVMQAIRSKNGQSFSSISYFIPIDHFLEWNEKTNHAYNFIWSKQSLPRMPFYQLKISSQIENIK